MSRVGYYGGLINLSTIKVAVVRIHLTVQYFWNNSWHLYFPDFYLEDYNMYIEIKGYETERDQYKWKVIDNLIIFKKEEIKFIKEQGCISKLIIKILKNKITDCKPSA